MHDVYRRLVAGFMLLHPTRHHQPFKQYNPCALWSFAFESESLSTGAATRNFMEIRLGR